MIESVPELRVEVVKAVAAPLPVPRFRQVLQAAMSHPEAAARARALEGASGGCQLTLRVTGDRELRRLSRTFLGEDRPTDVLSFPSGQDGYLGDLALSWPAVVRQAEAYGHPVEVEAALLCVHGLLHLLGWDHANPTQERDMTTLTKACLARARLTLADTRLLSRALARRHSTEP
jgi:probable rRNA maturation factor